MKRRIKNDQDKSNKFSKQVGRRANKVNSWSNFVGFSIYMEFRSMTHHSGAYINSENDLTAPASNNKMSPSITMGRITRRHYYKRRFKRKS